jgi:ABC-type branched-subunit amino acid transport system ATPase component
VSTPLLECRDVQVAYDGVQVLFGIDLTVDRGEVVALLGTNGAGKSTLLKAVCGLAPVTGGSVRFDGRDVTHDKAPALARQGISLVPGGKGVFGSLTVLEHLRLAGWGADKRLHAERVEETLDLLPRLRERMTTSAGDLSGGEQQMLALAIAFVTKPPLLLLDELSLGLAPTIVATLLAAVRTVAAAGTTIVLVEQSINVALTVASRATFLEKGRVVFSGPTADLLDRPDVLRSVLLSGSTDRLQAVEREAVQDEPLPRLRATGLVKRYGGVTAVDDVDLEVRAGEVVGILGPNGSGKTTLLDLLAGTSPADAGAVHLGATDISSWPARRRSLAGLGRSFQDAKLFPALSVAQNVAVALERHLAVRDPLADALHLPALQRVEEDVRWTVGDLLALTGLLGLADRPAGDLSTGTRRVLDLTLALAHDPSVLLLDEPGAGVAQREAEALGPLLRRVAGATGCALVLVEHDVPLLRGLCDRLIAMVEGQVVASGTPDEVLAHPVVVAAYLGGDKAAVERSGARSR